MLTSVSVWMIKAALLGGKLKLANMQQGYPAASTGMPAASQKMPSMDTGPGSGAALPALPSIAHGANTNPASSPQTSSPTIAAQPGQTNTMPSPGA